MITKLIHPKIMRALNLINCDCFKNHKTHFIDCSTEKAYKALKKGADLLNLPEIDDVPLFLELIKNLKAHYPLPISIETKKPSVTQKALELGVDLIIDTSGFDHKKIRELAALYGVNLCIAQRKVSRPRSFLVSENDMGLTTFLLMWFEKRISLLLHEGIQSSQIFLDPGLSFNIRKHPFPNILEVVQKLKSLGYNLILGDFQSENPLTLNNCDESLPATILSNTIALLSGADIIRVSNDNEHKTLKRVFDSLQKHSLISK